MPAESGRAGKFLAEERLVGDYALRGPVATLELKYKRRVYLNPTFTDKQYQKLHSKSSLRKFLEFCAKRNVAKVAELVSKGTDPNFHDDETGETCVLTNHIPNHSISPIIQATHNSPCPSRVFHSTSSKPHHAPTNSCDIACSVYSACLLAVWKSRLALRSCTAV